MPIQVTPTNPNDAILSHKLLDRLDTIGNDSVKNFAKNFLSAKTPPLFYTVEMETVNRCNNDCPFCPVNRHNDTRKAAKMDENLFKSIIDQLAHINYSGYLSLFSNNEPLLDNRIFDFIDYAKKRLPNATHALYTNGTLMDKEKFLRLTRSLDSLIIDNYDDDFQIMPNIQEILDSDIPKDFTCNVNIPLRKKNQILNTRGGKAPNRINEENKFNAYSACNLPFSQMIIRPDGTLGKCCNDPLSDMILGDLNNQTLLEAWYGKNYQELRKEMYYNGRNRISGCEHCDIFGLYNYLPSSAFTDELKRWTEVLTLRKNLGEIFVLDTTAKSQEIINHLNLYGVQFDGMINFRNQEIISDNLKILTLEQAIDSKVFILVPSPYYEDTLFDLLVHAGYQYEKDFLIYTI